MVDNCDVLLAIWDGNKSGGVWSTIRKAKKACKKIIYCPQEIVTKYQEKLMSITHDLNTLCYEVGACKSPY